MIISESSLYRTASPIEYYIDSNGCWICTSHAVNTAGGYPRIRRNGKQIMVHRYVYELLVKKIEAELELCHSCDNTLCINPSCMWEGTHRENMLDSENKNRSFLAKGEYNGMSKLTKQHADNIRELYSTNELTQKDLGELFGVHWCTIRDVLSNRTWNYI